MQIPDPKSVKPETWLDDAPDMIADPASEMPSDWDEEEDGAWEAPLIKNPDCEKFGCGEWKAPVISNPDYKGKWVAPKIDNPDYKGVWSPRKVENPNFFVDERPHEVAPIGGLGIELWTMQDGILFDNILLTADPAVASGLAEKTFVKRKAVMDAEKKSAKRDETLEKKEGFVGNLYYYAYKALYFAQDNALLVGGSLCLGLIPLILFCCMGGKKDESDGEAAEAEPAADAAADGAEDEGDEGEEEGDEGEEAAVEEVEEEPKEEEKPKGGAKKRKPPKAN